MVDRSVTASANVDLVVAMVKAYNAGEIDAMLEFYAAYETYDSIAVLTRELIQEAAQAALGTQVVTLADGTKYDLSGEWARSDFDRRHRFELLGTINPGKLFNLGVSASLYSGTPYALTTGIDAFHTGTANARPLGIPRNSLQGPGYVDLDLRWSRDFALIRSKKKDGGLKATLAIDAFNVLNRVNYSFFVGNLSSPFFGRAVSAQPPRRLQLSFRLKF